MSNIQNHLEMTDEFQKTIDYFNAVSCIAHLINNNFNEAELVLNTSHKWGLATIIETISDAGKKSLYELNEKYKIMK